MVISDCLFWGLLPHPVLRIPDGRFGCRCQFADCSAANPGWFHAVGEAGGGRGHRLVELQLPDPPLNTLEPGTEQRADTLQRNAKGACQPGDFADQPDRGRDVVQVRADEDDADDEDGGERYNPPETGENTLGHPYARGVVVGQLEDVAGGLFAGEQLAPDPALDLDRRLRRCPVTVRPRPVSPLLPA